ncbi:MAG: CPXCG motif-containing cysteine-rich protein [Elusimicrobia bacterium]|nr:CPXCG motif-containing cysteine-rich protein [Elusimicrobiota bacterium]
MQEETPVDCPHCGEPFTILIDASVPRQDYVEDCFVCCRPIRFKVVCADGAVESVEALRE